jgi:hypothetical protein
LTAPEASRLLGRGDHFLARAVRRGIVKLEKCGNRYLVREDQLSELERTLEEHGVQRYSRGQEESDA